MTPGRTFIERCALELEVVKLEHGVAHVAVRVRRFWLPFYVAEMVTPWWAKPIVFAWSAWRFWVCRDCI